MSTITESNFNRLFSEKLDLRWNLLTESLDSVSRFNLPERFIRSDEFNSRVLCENIAKAFEQFKPNLSEEQKERAVKNLTSMREKFSKTTTVDKMSCGNTIDEIINNLKTKASGSKKSGFESLAPQTYTYQPSATVQPNAAAPMRVSPSKWNKKESIPKSDPVPIGRITSPTSERVSRRKKRRSSKDTTSSVSARPTWNFDTNQSTKNRRPKETASITPPGTVIAKQAEEIVKNRKRVQKNIERLKN